MATALDVMGDKWTLLIIRDIGFFGRHRNKQIQEAGEGIPTNILADRLKKLVDQGLLDKRPYQDNPPRFQYHLTEAGEQLIPVVMAMARWAGNNVIGIRMPDEFPDQDPGPAI